MNGIRFTQTPDLSVIGGTSLSPKALASINGSCGAPSNYFTSSNFAIHKNYNYQIKIVDQVRQERVRISNMNNVLSSNERYIPLTCEDHLRCVPIEQQLSILQYAPIRKLFDQGRISGYGYREIPIGDPYEHLISNGAVHDADSKVDSDGYIEFVNIHHDDDPDITFEETDAIESTRQFLDQYLEESNNDPTDVNSLLG